jgi:hypothetical protein
VESTILCEKPKTNVAAKKRRRSFGIFVRVFFVRVIMVLTFYCRLPSRERGLEFLHVSRFTLHVKTVSGFKQYPRNNLYFLTHFPVSIYVFTKEK